MVTSNQIVCVSSSLAAYFKPLNHRRNVASLNLFCRYYSDRCSYELVELVPLPHSQGMSIRYSNRLHDFSITIPRCYKDVSVNSFFPCTPRLESFACRLLSFDL